jgi:hypothetical protein
MFGFPRVMDDEEVLNGMRDRLDQDHHASVPEQHASMVDSSQEDLPATTLQEEHIHHHHQTAGIIIDETHLPEVMTAETARPVAITDATHRQERVIAHHR